MMRYVYFLRMSNAKVYTGSNADPKVRLKTRMAGRVKSTRNFRPLELIGYEAYSIKSDALRRERFMKTTEGKRLFKQQYRDIIAKLSSNKGQ